MSGIVKFPRVLVGTPIYDGKEYCRARFVNNVQNFDYPNYSWMLVDNSADPAYARMLQKQYSMGHVARVPRGKNSRDALANASNFLRKKAIEGGFDYLLMLESDVFPPKDVIYRLIRHGYPVVGATYHIGIGSFKRLCLFKVHFKKELGMMGTALIGMDEQNDFTNKGLKIVHGMGVGCVLIHKSILERFPFWYSSVDDARMAHLGERKHPDVYFYMDLQNNGVRVLADTDIHCEHEFSSWNSVHDV